IEVDGTSHLTMARELQRHPVRHTVVHVDFQVVRRDEVMAADVPLTLVGEADAVHRADGVIEQQLFSLTVHATPARIPHGIEVDIAKMVIGDTVRVGDVALPDGVSTEVDPDVAIVVAQPPQVTEAALLTEAELEAAAEAGEEAGEAGEEAGEGGATAPAEGGEG
ncbi:MAG TPA: 50S ribosomal protein L25, partial [Sphingomicrobium sp.]|nr:50S ribosomal protein L25 [Sphingomicrobium sp.]